MLIFTAEETTGMFQVEVDEMLRLMCHIAAKVPPNNAMPCRIVLFVKLLSNILLYVVLFHGLHGTVHGILLHFIRHVCIFDHCLFVRHLGFLTAHEKTKTNKIIFSDIFFPHMLLTSCTSANQ
uniref:Uncharacterized protein n=1 Tax=Echeneis naucrates TaxID=173247 RepID=A0A665U0T0_ECHNA